ncbi:putative protein N(5)-glutamine methyltransferase [Arthrobacter sp. zg-Y20]|uniref:putative protein N(5)-glutamine methyltransferase n=1 Tax=unclassified Arthrobacter TaxID=235627 RepID=UPI001D15D5EC|nr:MULTISPECIES: putative protein N(5)-glutamine methyltransferase [unclassified Arthrobacter]MCC3274583.1 putative protein N(5)-glutamine methyltransferase [Arthrobacter sp. zg-Y20]MDK1314740.1 putative protein N(5)-glutamine methyltransferase [Arthrobacter sp. zg.Y20]WIB07719.1 putative protein N(5)-glutamine methyltransferase [Arthrobacter sp. zg-Y20]
MGRAPAPAGAGRVVALLRAAGCVYAEEEAALLLAEAADDAGLERMLAERAAGRPLEYVLGWAQFCGLRLNVGDGVFVPRRRTEFLARLALTELVERPRAVVVDLCCGAGPVSAVIARRADPDKIFAVDIDAAAVACAQRNLDARATVLQGNLFDALPGGLRGRVDLVVANAPYVPTGQLAMLPPEARLHEPEVTHDGGPDGLAVLSRIAAQAPAWLAPSGVLLVECAAGQVEGLSHSFAAAGLVPAVRRRRAMDATVLRGSVLGGSVLGGSVLGGSAEFRP